MTSSHRLSPGKKGSSVIEHFNTQLVSNFLLFYYRGNSVPKLIFISLTDTTSKQFWNPFGWATPILVRRCRPLRSSLHVCWKSALMAIMPRFLHVLSSPYFCLRPSWYTKNSCLSFSKTSSPAVVGVLRYSVLFFFGIVLFICFRQLNEKD